MTFAQLFSGKYFRPYGNYARYTLCAMQSYVIFKCTTLLYITEHQMQQNSNMTYQLELTALKNVPESVPESSRFQCIGYAWT